MILCETDRLRLRHLSSADAAFILELLNDPGFIQNIGDRGVRTIEAARQYILTGPVASYEQFGFGLNLVELQQSSLAIGICGLLRRDSHPETEIGFAFLPASRGKGYASEAARAVIELAIRSLQLARIVALTAPDNQDSIRLLEKLGFRFDRMVTWTDPQGESKLFILDAPGEFTVPPPP
jgi:[ribosomal protein S5]-alanine N-acetyltransferase